MATNESTPARPSLFAILFNYGITLFVIGFLIVMLYLVWPMVRARISGMPELPTAALVPQARPVAPAQPRAEDRPVAAPALPGIAQNEATATAMYNAAINAANAAPVPNTDSAPITAEEKPAVREHAVENAPTTEPLTNQPSDDQTGARRRVPNPQAGQCLHGAVWTDHGCKNPTPQD